MPDEVDDLILKMQHLEAQARAAVSARTQGDRASKLKTRAQQMAALAQDELAAAEKDLAEGEAKQQRARAPGTSPLEASDLLLSGRALAQDAKTRVIKSRAKLNFALDQMDEAERQSWNSMQAEAAAETHAQLAESGADSSRAPAAGETSAGASVAAAPAPKPAPSFEAPFDSTINSGRGSGGQGSAT